MLIISEPHFLGLLAAAGVRLPGADDCGAGKRDHWLHLWESGKERSSGEPHGAARRHDQLQRVADSRGVEFPQSFKIGRVWQARHGGFLRSSSSELSLYWEPPRSARLLLLRADHQPERDDQ